MRIFPAGRWSPQFGRKGRRGSHAHDLDRGFIRTRITEDDSRRMSAGCRRRESRPAGADAVDDRSAQMPRDSTCSHCLDSPAPVQQVGGVRPTAGRHRGQAPLTSAFQRSCDSVHRVPPRGWPARRVSLSTSGLTPSSGSGLFPLFRRHGPQGSGGGGHRIAVRIVGLFRAAAAKPEARPAIAGQRVVRAGELGPLG